MLRARPQECLEYAHIMLRTRPQNAWSTPARMLRARPHFLLVITLPICACNSLPLFLTLSLTGEHGSHTLFTGQIEREGERGRKREGGREREGEREREREMSRIVIFIFERNEGCLGPF